ncbi:putative WD repeat-containing protein C2A9.03 [Bidens hawaiensis]|uniref:putative WD repeat-containing protein C2A9.03 n=1 Tax=Bidens hawaiensis TaxID=980011 RepID=UPI0040499EA1
MLEAFKESLFVRDWINKEGLAFVQARTTCQDKAITNAIEIYNTISGGKHFMASNNDCGVREYDIDGFQLVNHFHFPWPVNTVGTVNGHRDYSFASAWHPDGRIFATGSQDKTCRLWDLRSLAKPVTVLKGNMAAIRSLRFSTDGQFLVVSEAADFVHVYSTNLNYETRQEIDFFGEIAGVSVSPDDESLYVGVWDRTYGSLLQFNKV